MTEFAKADEIFRRLDAERKARMIGLADLFVVLPVEDVRV